MEIRLRRNHYIYFVDKSGNIEFYPFWEFAKLTGKDSKICLPKYKNCLVHYIAASVLKQDEIPFKIERMAYCNLKFDSEGKVKWDGHREASALVKKYQNFKSKVQDSYKDLKPKDEKELFEILHKKNRWLWEPSEHIKNAVVEDIFS